MRKPLSDHALQHVTALGERVRALEAKLVEARAQFADAVDRFLPPTATPDEIRRFTDVSGFGRTLVDAIREERPHSWRRIKF